MLLSYGELEGYLAEMHHVSNNKRAALKGRLKHFQRLGWPSGTNQGKGARVQYGVGQTLSLALGLEMLQLGLTPEKIVEQMRLGGISLPYGFIECLDQYGPEAEPIFYAFSPEALSSFRGVDTKGEGGIGLMVSQSELQNALSHTVLDTRRLALIDMAAVFEGYVSYFRGNGLGEAEDLREPLMSWQKMVSDAIDKRNARLMAEVSSGDT